ncbi:MAG TPA: hypothetical protein VFF82_08190, partial [Rhodocyclaceae bacterium]|nr:hypothetical protein [Rhodocyclaceae bacterium]
SVTATVCTRCGAALPSIEAAYEVTRTLPKTAGFSGREGRANMISVARSSVVPSLVPPPARPLGAWPLIIVAVVAGGLPLLWMYRDNMPLPKAWQPQMQNAAPAPPLPTTAPVAEPAPVPANTETTSRDAEKGEPAPKNAASVRTTRKIAQAGRTKPPAQREPEVAQPATESGSAAPKEAAPECTKALASIGFCDPKTGH